MSIHLPDLRRDHPVLHPELCIGDYNATTVVPEVPGAEYVEKLELELDDEPAIDVRLLANTRADLHLVLEGWSGL